MFSFPSRIHKTYISPTSEVAQIIIINIFHLSVQIPDVHRKSEAISHNTLKVHRDQQQNLE